MVGRVICAVILPIWCVACAQGIDPPDATRVIFLPGTDDSSFQVGHRPLAPCGRIKVDSERNPESGMRRFGFTLPADEAAESERIVHAVRVDGFCMDAHEVTVRQYEHCVLRGLCEKPQLTNAGDEDRPGFVARYYSQPKTYADYPVVGVSRDGAEQYCAFRGGRLPTEVEWEYAARSRGQRAQIWEQDAVASNIDGECRDYAGDIAVGACSQGVGPVGQSAQDMTKDGLMDMAGNVAEWTADQYDILAYCAQKQPNDANISDLFDQTDGSSAAYRAMNEQLLEPMPSCLYVDGDADIYTGACRDDFETCRGLTCDGLIKPDINADQTEANACLMNCFEQFEQCIEPCMSPSMLTVCARQDNQNSCRPTPWCAPRIDWPSQQPHILPFTVTREMQYVVRGGHFQSANACEARPTRRRGQALGGSTVGFRCAYPPQTSTCRAVQP